MLAEKSIKAAAGLAVLLACALPLRSAPADPSRARVEQLVAAIRRADYEGDRPSLKRLFGELASFDGDPELGSRVDYWRGFALWRRALNGFNESPFPSDLGSDLDLAVALFDAAVRKDVSFVDAKVGEVSCLMSLVFLNQKDAARMQAYLARAIPLVKEAQAQAPDNPRLLWVVGANQWYRATNGLGGSTQTALDTYERGLAAIKNQKPGDPLEPSWGEPELLMNLAWSHLHATPPDPVGAQKFADSALSLVPNWHYVRDILIPQIREARARQQVQPAP